MKISLRLVHSDFSRVTPSGEWREQMFWGGGGAFSSIYTPIYLLKKKATIEDNYSKLLTSA